ncbi:MAG: 3-deoxy-D-manno-octulosonic acid transferase [Rickettsiales bacterium]|nr:3-deoxy-D-manno-octulosonic acid transferase [Rickettsiales bacterium]
MILKLYRAISFGLYPFIWGWLRWRVRRGKEDGSRLRERFGRSVLPRPAGKLLWFHAASVGESNSIIPLLESLHAAVPDLNMLVTTGTVSSSQTIKNRLPERAVHQFVPVDLPGAVDRFLKHWKPDAAIWVESELWPNMIIQTGKRKIPMMLMNARMSDRSQSRWHRFRASFHTLMKPFTTLYAGSENDLRKFKNLGISNMQYVGNIKYDAPILPADSKRTSKLLSNMGDRRIWLAASTHPGEEEIVAQAHKHLRETFPELLTLLVPRHAHRGKEIAKMLREKKLTVGRRSKNHVLLPETDIYIADTMGELGMFYRLAGIVMVGGSFVPRGGHNPIEPAQLDCAVICGPHMYNFTGICKELMAENALDQVTNVEQLEDKIAHYLRDHDAQEQQAKRALAAVKNRVGTAAILEREILTMLGFEVASEEEGEEPSEDVAL